MAEKRGFSKQIVESDLFLSLPISAQVLYFHIGIHARDKGVLNNIFSIARSLGCSHDDVAKLWDKGFIKPILNTEPCEEWEIVHWYENNGIGETAKKRNNYKYRQWRQAVIERDKKCVVCGAKKQPSCTSHPKICRLPFVEV